MERYVFFDPSRSPPGLAVIGIPTQNGFVWVELTAGEYEGAVADPEVARRLAAYASEVLACRLPKAEAHAMEWKPVRHQLEAAEEERMQTLVKQGLITPRNFPRLSTRIVPRDQREAIRPGIIIRHYGFTTQHGQSGYVLISHTTQRAGICFGEQRSEWGRWSAETGTITTDGGRLYNRVGEPLFDLGYQALGYGEATRRGWRWWESPYPPLGLSAAKWQSRDTRISGFAGGKRYHAEEEGVMADRDWNLITSGATFEALATTLIFFKDPKAALFGRRGKDGGQDARSGDGTRVFQANHHEDGSAAKALADAKAVPERTRCSHK
jgi:hypothetical protein